MAHLNWDQREQLLLAAICDLEDEEHDLGNARLVEVSGLSDGDVSRGLQALLDGHLVIGIDAADYDTAPGQAELMSIRLAPAGRRHVRQWPTEADAREALLAVLDDALARTDDPEQQTAIEQTKRGVRGLAGKVVTEVAVALAKRASGLDG